MSEEHGASVTARPAHRVRLPLVDGARGVALVAMAAYHFAWDLDFFAFTDAEVASAPLWKAFAATIAASFLILVGVGLALAHGSGLRRREFLRRLGVVALAAAAVTLVTSLATPDGAVWFGVLHCIAVSSLLALPFLRAHPGFTLAAALACFGAAQAFASPAFDGPAWIWSGLAATPPRTNDYVPLLPWFGWVLVGVAATAFLGERLWATASWPVPPPLAWLGRHSLAFYLLHQPLLFGVLWLVLQIAGPNERVETVRFGRGCQQSCTRSGSALETCVDYCGCIIEGSRRDGLWRAIQRGGLDGDENRRFQSVIATCRR